MMTKFSAYALILGGILYLITNSVLTLQLPLDVPGTDVFASRAFLLRLSFAAAAVFFLLIGSVGVYVRQSHNTGWFGSLVFALTFVGCAFVFAHEWGQVFFLHELAKVAPEGLQALEDIEGANLYDIEALLVLSLFMIGWFLFAISMLIARVYPRPGPILLIAGFLAVSILSPVLPGLWGFVVGNSVVALGWIVLGWQSTRLAVVAAGPESV
jgi:hypothetical protein